MIDRDTLMEAGEAAFGPGFLYHGMWTFNDAQLTRFAQAVAQKAVEGEREAIAQEFDRRATPATGFYEPHEPAEIVRNRGIGGES